MDNIHSLETPQSKLVETVYHSDLEISCANDTTSRELDAGSNTGVMTARVSAHAQGRWFRTVSLDGARGQ